jgi:polar amino acid transport system substrate-binding protein
MKKILLGALLATSMAMPGNAADLGGKILTIATDPTFPPHESMIDGIVAGYDVDVVAEICARINCVPQWQPTAWDGIFPGLENGDYDMVVSGVSITDERDKTMDFSDPYIVVQQGILMRVEDAGKTIEDFKSGDLRLSSQTGTTNAQLGEELVGRDNLQLFDSFGNAVVALNNGDVDGVVLDGTAAFAYEQEFAGELKLVVTGLQADPFGLVFPEGDPMVDAFNEGLASIAADGTLDKLVIKWWPKQ